MKSRESRKKKRTNLTAHRRALAEAAVRDLVAVIKQRWSMMGRVERGERLRELAEMGCSTRGLEEAIGQSATTIRRYIEIAKLPEHSRAAMNAGASAKKILAETARHKRLSRTRERIAHDRATGTLSDDVADMVLSFCRADGKKPLQAPVLKSDLSLFLPAVAAHLARLGASGAGRLRVSKRAGMEPLTKQARPPVQSDVFWIEHQAEWLAKMVWAIAPEHPIWEAGLRKAERRANELEPKKKKTPLQLYLERAEHLATLASSPERRRY